MSDHATGTASLSQVMIYLTWTVAAIHNTSPDSPDSRNINIIITYSINVSEENLF